MKRSGFTFLSLGREEGKPTTSLSGGMTSPARDWRIIFYTFIVLNLVAVGFHIFLYYTLSSGEFFEVEGESPSSVETLDQAKLSDVLDYFEGRREELRVRLTEPEVIPEVE